MNRDSHNISEQKNAPHQLYENVSHESSERDDSTLSYAARKGVCLFTKIARNIIFLDGEESFFIYFCTGILFLYLLN